MFAGPLAEVLGNGKYTEWVLRRDFTEDHLLCLLCMVGEFDTHAPEVMRLLWQNASRLKGMARRTQRIAIGPDGTEIPVSTD